MPCVRPGDTGASTWRSGAICALQVPVVSGTSVHGPLGSSPADTVATPTRLFVITVSWGSQTSMPMPDSSTGPASPAPAFFTTSAAPGPAGSSGSRMVAPAPPIGVGLDATRYRSPAASRTIAFTVTRISAIVVASSGTRCPSPVPGSNTNRPIEVMSNRGEMRRYAVPAGSVTRLGSGRPSRSACIRSPSGWADWSSRRSVIPAAVRASIPSRSPEPAANETPFGIRSTGDTCSTPASAAYSPGSAHAGRAPSAWPGTTRTSAPAWYAAWSRCEPDHVAAYETANTPIEIAIMSSSAERV